MTSEALTRKEREFLTQLIDLRRRESMLRQENEKLRITVRELRVQIKRLRAELQACSESVLKSRLDHALNELANPKRSKYLSNEEWRMVRESRGICI
jgi:hypothetical protein